MKARHIKTMNIILILIAFSSLCLIALCTSAYLDTHITYFKYEKITLALLLGFVPLFSALFFYRKKMESKFSFLIVFFFSYALLFLGDFALSLSTQKPEEKLKNTLTQKAAEQGRSFDHRNMIEFTLDRNRQANSQLVPRVAPKSHWLEPLMVEGRKYMPVHDIPGTNIVVCNETGTWLTATQDRYGYNNPDRNWKYSEFDVVLLGDSFTWGQCVEPDKNLAGQIQKHISKTINLGSGGNGPLTELASLREFLQIKQGKHFFWIYFEGNDFQDLEHEQSSEFLMKYIKNSIFTQNSFRRINAIREEQLKSGQSALEHAAHQIQSPLKSQLKHALLLDTFRQRLLEAFKAPKLTPNYSLFQQTLEQAKKEITNQGGLLTFIFLPDHARYTLRDIDSYDFYIDKVFRNLAKEKMKVLEIVKSLNLDIIDADLIFRRHGNPRQLYVFDLPTHYTETGYKLIAQAMLEYLDQKK